MIELADYSISQCLHEGSETAVYRGLRRRDGLPVVVKMPRLEHPSPAVVDRLRHEYALLREYAQPGVVKGLELVRSPSSVALVLEYVEGEPLTELVRSRQLDLALVLRIGLALAEILTRLHERHVVHKDLKPHKLTRERAGPANDPRRLEVLANLRTWKRVDAGGVSGWPRKK